MNIIFFQYNRNVSAIVLQENLARGEACGGCRPVGNQFLASGYEDRLLWEEASALRPAVQGDYPIPGTWQ